MYVSTYVFVCAFVPVKSSGLGQLSCLCLPGSEELSNSQKKSFEDRELCNEFWSLWMSRSSGKYDAIPKVHRYIVELVDIFEGLLR